jgi:hypothetical protein
VWDDNHSHVVYCPFSRFRIIVVSGSDIVYNALNLYKYTFLTVKNLDKIFSQNRKRSVPIMPLSDVMNFSAPPVFSSLPAGFSTAVARKRLYRVAKRALSGCDIGHIGARYGPYQRLKRAISQRSMTAIGTPENVSN